MELVRFLSNVAFSYRKELRTGEPWSTDPNPKSRLHSFKSVRGKALNHGFTLAYAFAILALFYHHTQKLLLLSHHYSFTSFSMLIADIILAFMWFTTTPFRMNPIIRHVFPENLQNVLERSKEGFPGLDIFICTADPYKEPPLGVVNTALSVMAYDYPTDKLSVYVSDDGGSQLTLFAFMEAVHFAKHWLPFCKQNNVIERSPDAFFKSNCPTNSEHGQIKMMYEKMKIRIENVVELGKVTEEYITNEQERQVFRKWTQEFSRQQHPSVIQVLSEFGKSKDIQGNSMPNLVYVSREKSKKFSHHCKAGAQNVLLRVSAIMTNAPIILTLDCDMLSNDPLTPHRMLCFFLMEDSTRPANNKLGHVQFPQRFHGLNKDDIYASELKRLFTINPMAMDGLKGPVFVGTGCFFRRRVFFGGPSSSSSLLFSLQSQIPELKNIDHVDKSISSREIINLAHHVSACNYEDQTEWGSKLGFRYGSLVEDYFTSYNIHCKGWESVLCNPERSAFLGDSPITLNDVLGQNKRWSFGLLEVAFSKYSPLTFGVRSSMGSLMALAYAHFAFAPIWFIPITIYSFLPQLTLLNKTSIFPKVGDPEFFLYAFLFLGSYTEDCIGFVMSEGTFKRWWSDQRMWLLRGLSSYTFGTVEYISKRLGIFPAQGFNVTNKAVDDERKKRYDQGKFEFGSQSVAVPMVVPLAMAAIINLIAFLFGLFEAVAMIKGGGKWDELFLQMFITGFGVLNSIPIYEAMVFRSDNGRMSTGTTVTSIVMASALLLASSYL